MSSHQLGLAAVGPTYCLLATGGISVIFDVGEKKRGLKKASLLDFQRVTAIRTVFIGLISGKTGLKPGRRNSFLKAPEWHPGLRKSHIALIM